MCFEVFFLQLFLFLLSSHVPVVFSLHGAEVVNITCTTQFFHWSNCNLYWTLWGFLHKVIFILVLTYFFQYWWIKELQHLRCVFWHMFSYEVICVSEIGYTCRSRAVALASTYALCSWKDVIDSHLFYGIVLFSHWIDASGSFKGSIHLSQLTVAFSLLSPKKEPHRCPLPSNHSIQNY